MPKHVFGGHHAKHKTFPKTAKTHRKTLKIKAHHAKPYRKRHWALLIVSIFGLVFLSGFILQYNESVQNDVRSARDFITNLFQTDQTPNNQDQTVNSTYGYSLTFNSLKYYGSAIDTVTGNLYVGSELNTNRAYEVVKISTNSIPTSSNPASLSINYYNRATRVDQSLADYNGLEKTFVTSPQNQDSQPYIPQSSSYVTLSGHKFKRTLWVKHLRSNLLTNTTVSFVSYVGIVNSQPFVIEVNNGITNTATDSINRDLQTIIDSLRFGAPTQAIKPVSRTVALNTQTSLSLIDKFMMTGIASAASNNPVINPSERDSAIYGPAVVKVYNVYCMDIFVKGKEFIKDACQGVSGSAFLLSQDGYLATNGHVASVSPKDIIIYDSLVNLTQKGDERLFDILAAIAGTGPSDPQLKGKTVKQILAYVVDKMYSIPDSTIEAKHSVSNLLIDLGETQPNVDELLKDTKARQTYPEQTNIKHALLKAADYRLIDNIDGFRASDVAIMKLSGSNFPVVKLGDINSISQGSNLNILGYPADATNNNIVDSKQSKLTLTTGKASAIKNAQGSANKLIETDTTIGHGNSGGPVLDDSGSVVGIATYTVDGSGSGNGTYNYIRDIKDLTDLASKSSIVFDTNSQTQANWQIAMNFFYSSHYSKAIKYFNKVKQLYPQHPTVDSLIAASEQKIKDGQDVKDFPVIPVAIAAGIALIGAGVAIFMIIRHKRKHEIYKSQMTGGSAPQAVVGGMTQPINNSQPGQAISSQPHPALVPQVSAPAAAVIAPTLPQTNQPVASQPVTQQVPIAPVQSPAASTSTPIPVVNAEVPPPQDSNIQNL